MNDDATSPQVIKEALDDSAEEIDQKNSNVTQQKAIILKMMQWTTTQHPLKL